MSRLKNMLLVAGTPLHRMVESFLLSNSYGVYVRPEYIEEAEHYARRASGDLLKELNERIGNDVQVWFTMHPPGDKDTWRISMCLSNEMMQYAAFGDPDVFRNTVDVVVRQMVEHMVSKICAKVRDITAERDGNEETVAD